MNSWPLFLCLSQRFPTKDERSGGNPGILDRKSLSMRALQIFHMKTHPHTLVPFIKPTQKQKTTNSTEAISSKRSAINVDKQHQTVSSPSPTQRKFADMGASMKKPLRPRALKIYSCGDCGKKFISEQSLHVHKMANHQTAVYKSTVPLQESPKTQSVVDPNKKPEDEPTQSCSMCEYKCQKINTLMEHVAKMHKKTNKARAFKCSACDLTFEYNCILKSHFLRKHTNIYKFSCNHCGKKYKVKGDLTNHIRFYHNETAIVCEICGKACSNSNSLYTHQKRFHYKPKFECKICKRRMVTQENLNQHVVTQHEKKERVICEECGKSFSSKIILDRHMESVHSGIKSHTCSVCDKSFSRVSHLRQHLLIHTGTRSFVCDICGKRFAQKPGLISHRKIHPGSHPPLPVMRLDNILNEFMKK